jgi:hypothetical protein
MPILGWPVQTSPCTHLHHCELPVLFCDEKAADAVLVREEEQVAAALLDEQLW